MSECTHNSVLFEWELSEEQLYYVGLECIGMGIVGGDNKTSGCVERMSYCDLASLLISSRGTYLLLREEQGCDAHCWCLLCGQVTLISV